MPQQKGFSLIEVIVVIALFAVIVSLGLLMSFESYRGATFRSERDTMVSALQKARSRAMANIDQAAWGVRYDGSPAYTYTIYKKVGSVSTDVDTIAGSKAAAISPAPFSVTFSQLSGTTTGTFSATIVENGRTTSPPVSVNYEGAINW